MDLYKLFLLISLAYSACITTTETNIQEELLNAITNANVQEVATLLKTPGIDVNQVKNNQYGAVTTPLLEALKIGNYQIVKMLIDKRADIKKSIYTWDNRGLQPYTEAIKTKNTQITQLFFPQLLSDPTFNINQDITYLKSPSKEFNTQTNILLEAIREENVPLVSLLLDKGADYNKRGYDRYDQYFPYGEAVRVGNKDIIALLKAKGYDYLYDNSGNTILTSAISTGLPLRNIQEIISKSPGLSNFKNYPGQTPLTLAIIRNNIPAIKALLNARADVNLADSNGILPVILAVNLGNLDALRVLINKGGNLNAKDSNGNTLLMIAVIKNNAPIVQYLLTTSIDVSAQNNAGQTVFQLAQGNSALANLILTKKGK